MKRIALSVVVILILMANVSLSSGRNANGEDSKKCYNQPEKMENAGKNSGEYLDCKDKSQESGFLKDINDLCTPVTKYPESPGMQTPESTGTQTSESTGTQTAESPDTQILELSDTLLSLDTDTQIPESTDTLLSESFDTDTQILESTDTQLSESQDTDTQISGTTDTQIPEFPTIALPVAAVFGLLFLFKRGR